MSHACLPTLIINLEDILNALLPKGRKYEMNYYNSEYTFQMREEGLCKQTPKIGMKTYLPYIFKDNDKICP